MDIISQASIPSVAALLKFLTLSVAARLRPIISLSGVLIHLSISISNLSAIFSAASLSLTSVGSQHTGDKAGMISHYMIPEVKFFTESSSWQSPVLQGC